jgi:hypothetical protein
MLWSRLYMQAVCGAAAGVAVCEGWWRAQAGGRQKHTGCSHPERVVMVMVVVVMVVVG